MIAARKSAGSWKRSERNTALSSLSVHRVPRGRNLVADTPDGDDRRSIPELAPQLADVHVDGARVAGEGVPPDALQQLVAREHEPLVVEELPEQVELLRRKLDLAIAQLHLAPPRVDRQAAVAEHARLALARVRFRAAADRLHARD